MPNPFSFGWLSLQLLREMNLAEIRRKAEVRFHLFVLGEEDAAREVAVKLATLPGGGLHPWVSWHATPLADEGVFQLPATPGAEAPYRLALLVTRDAELHAPDARAHEALVRAGVETIVVLLGGSRLADEGVEPVARPGEAARVRVPAQPTPEELAEALVPAFEAALPEGRGLWVALPRRLPALRQAMVMRMIELVSRVNASYAATTGLAEQIPVLNVPLNAADAIILTKNQLILAYRIALAVGTEGEPRVVMGELLSVIGGGLLFRQVARGLVGLVPVIGWLPKVAVAYAGTRVIGMAAWHWATEGRRLPVEETRRLWRDSMSLAGGLARRATRRFRRARPSPLPEPRPSAVVDDVQRETEIGELTERPEGLEPDAASGAAPEG